jgi:chromosome condensin MukBEF ATPase and DNA-binding subunit MukB
LKSTKSDLSAAQASNAKSAARCRVLEDDLAKMTKLQEEAVQDSVAMRMTLRKNEEQLAAKMAEAAAEANKAAEASRLLESLRRDFNESSLKGEHSPPLIGAVYP